MADLEAEEVEEVELFFMAEEDGVRVRGALLAKFPEGLRCRGAGGIILAAIRAADAALRRTAASPELGVVFSAGAGAGEGFAAAVAGITASPAATSGGVSGTKTGVAAASFGEDTDITAEVGVGTPCAPTSWELVLPVAVAAATGDGSVLALGGDGPGEASILVGEGRSCGGSSARALAGARRRMARSAALRSRESVLIAAAVLDEEYTEEESSKLLVEFPLSTRRKLAAEEARAGDFCVFLLGDTAGGAPGA